MAIGRTQNNFSLLPKNLPQSEWTLLTGRKAQVRPDGKRGVARPPGEIGLKGKGKESKEAIGRIGGEEQERVFEIDLGKGDR